MESTQDFTLHQELEELLQRVISGNISREQYFKAFETVYRVCGTDESFERTCRSALSMLRNHVRDVVLTRLDRSSDASFLISLRDEWQAFRKIMAHLQLLFRHLDGHIGFMNRLKLENKKSIKEIAPRVWRDVLLYPLQHEITTRFIEVIDRDRKGEHAFSDEVLETVVKAIASLGEVEDDAAHVYQSLRTAYLVNLEEYFWMNLPKTQNAQEFLDHAKRFIAEELRRARRYLRPDDESVSETLHRLLLANNPNFLSKMVENALMSLDCQKLGELYAMLRPMNEPGLHLLHAAIVSSYPQHVRRIYDESTKAETDPASSFVRTVMMTEEHLRKVVRVAFNGDPIFELPCIAVCQNAVTQVEELAKGTSAELVAKHYNNILDSGKYKDAESLNRELEQALSAAKYVTSAQDFHNAYLDLLRVRLIKNRWCRVKFEKQAVDALRAAIGKEFTDRLPAVLKDIFDSRLVNQVCRGFPPDNGTGISFKNFEATTLSREHWLFEASGSDMKLPEGIEKTMRLYATIYRDKLRGASQSNRNGWVPLRSVTWYHNMSQVELEANFSHLSYLMKCSAFTAVVLLLFEKSTTRSVAYIRKETRLSDVDLEATLAQLEKLKVLTRAAESTELTLNCNFEHESSVVNLLEPLVTRSIRKLVKKTKNSADQQYYIEALLVRILKKHRQLRYDALLEKIREAAPKLKLDVDVTLILKSLASLKEKQYIEDVESCYHYLP